MAPRAALAQTQATSSFNVTLVVAAACTISATPITFPDGSITSGLPTPAAEGTVTVNCPSDTSYNVGLDAGQNYDVTRVMKSSAGGEVSYLLYQDAGHTVQWGDTGLSTSTGATGNPVTGAGSGSDQTLTIYGSLASSFFELLPGSYSDTVNVVVDF